MAQLHHANAFYAQVFEAIRRKLLRIKQFPKSMVLLEAFLFALGITSGYTANAPSSIPVTVVPNTYSDGRSMEHDTLLVIDVAVGTPGDKSFREKNCRMLFQHSV